MAKLIWNVSTMQMLIAPKLIQFRLKRIRKRGKKTTYTVYVTSNVLYVTYIIVVEPRVQYSRTTICTQRRGNLVSSDFHPMRNKMWIKFSLQPNQLFFHRFVAWAPRLALCTKLLSVSPSNAPSLSHSSVAHLFSQYVRLCAVPHRAMTVQPSVAIHLSNLNECPCICVFSCLWTQWITWTHILTWNEYFSFVFGMEMYSLEVYILLNTKLLFVWSYTKLNIYSVWIFYYHRFTHWWKYLYPIWVQN